MEWKKIQYKTYEENGEDAYAPVEEQMDEIIEWYNKGTVLVADVSLYGYERVNILLLEGFEYLESGEDIEKQMGDRYNKACIFNNDLKGAEYYMCIPSPYEKK